MAQSTTSPGTPNLVYGQVTDTRSKPLRGLIVKAYDRDMRDEELLGECKTDNNGRYSITWFHEQLRGSGKGSADLAIKVFAPGRRTPLFATGIDAVRFNAGRSELFDLVVATDVPWRGSEYDALLEEVTYLAGKVAVAELKEDEQHRDITFLSKEMRIPAVRIGYLVVAHRLQAISEIDPAFFYAILRRNTLLNTNTGDVMRIRLSIDVNTRPESLLYDAALADPKVLLADVKAAAKADLVSDEVFKNAPKAIEQLRRFRERAAAYYEKEHRENVLKAVGQFIADDKIANLIRLYEENPNDIQGFLKKSTDANFFKTKHDKQAAEVTAALGSLIGFDAGVIDKVRQHQKIARPEDMRRLAAMPPKDWAEVLSQTVGKGADKKRIGRQASLLARRMEKTYPTTAFAAQLRRERKPALRYAGEVAALLEANESFDLRHGNVEDLFSKKRGASKPTPGLVDELKAVQRVFRLAPQYGQTTALLRHNVRSAQSIVTAGRSRFLRDIAPQAGIPVRDAKTIFRQAERTHTAATLLVGEFQDALRSLDINALSGGASPRGLATASSRFPNLKSLFNLTDACACEHCRSVYSPAAYLVEILQFLDNRTVNDTVANTSGRLAKDELFQRRPDLGEIDLSCANANTPLPYIDLVCELLEQEVAPDPGLVFAGNLSDGPDPLTGPVSAALLAALQGSGMPATASATVFRTEDATTVNGPEVAPFKPHYLRDAAVVCKIIHTGGNNYKVFRLRQTLSDAESLAAAPEYVNNAAYTVLKNAKQAFQLPFDLFHTEARAYFERFGVARPELMRLFQAGGIPTDLAISAERLGLTEAETGLIVLADVAGQQTYWNTTSATASTEMQVVDTFLTQSGLSYQELERLLTLTFVDPTGNLFIRHNDLSCDTTQKNIANLSDTVLDRMHRFLRLFRKTGWKMEFLDEVVRQPRLGNGALNDGCLKAAAGLVEASALSGVKPDDLPGFFGTFPHQQRHPDAPQPLYQRVFLNKAKNGFIDDRFLPAKVALGADTLAAVMTNLSVCLQTSETDLKWWLPLLPDGQLTFANLSFLFAAARLKRALKFSAAELADLLVLSDIPFQNSPAELIKLINAAHEAKGLPVKLSEVRYMLRHEAANLDVREMQEAKITAVLKGLQTGYQQAFASTRSPFDPDLKAEEQAQNLQALLSPLPGVSENDVNAVLGYLNRVWPSPAAAKAHIDAVFGKLVDTTDVKTALDTLAALPVGADISAESLDLVEAWMIVLSKRAFTVARRKILVDTLTSTFKSDAALVETVLDHVLLRQPAPGTDKIHDLLTTDALIDMVNDPPAPPAVIPATFGKLYDALRLLHKTLPLAAAFKLSAPDLSWHFKNNGGLGWFLWDELPYKAAQNPVSYRRFADFAAFAAIAKRLSPVVDPADPENPVSFFTVASMLLATHPAGRTEFLNAYALLLGADAAVLDALDAHLFPGAWTKATYHVPQAWQALEDGESMLRMLGATVAQAVAYSKASLTQTDAATLRTALKARYDESTWLTTLKEITDAVRPQKRDALVAYLLATRPEFADANDLYDRFLIDVQMEACMPSSRIVQAHGVVQLFVQRCLMGLEPEAAADSSNDVGWDQWKWMRNYRVWEANRKVFLYPENWIEAELRDDKSFLFTELETELLQNEVNDYNSEQALIRYLEKLDNLAFLEVVATWYSTKTKIMHVFARTKGGDPASYFYRRFEQERYWSPWEKVELDITSDQLVAFERNNRLMLGWLAFSEEPEPQPKATIPGSTAGSQVDADKPKRKLRIQLAVSEYANKKWQPKRVSKDAILTPTDYTTDDSLLRRDGYNMLYFEPGRQVWLFTQPLKDVESYQLAGIFALAGCKGYPELAFQGSGYMPDFLPDFRDTVLTTQRYREANMIAPNDLSVRNGVSFFSFLELLHETPGNFRLTYPHQLTWIDLISLLFQYLLQFIFGQKIHDRSIKLPFGTLLPYFMEDSNHAYAIIPGFYPQKTDDPEAPTPRTASNVLQLIEDVFALFQKYMALYQADPNHDANALLQQLVADNDFQEILAEMAVYQQLTYRERFINAYHPLLCSLRTTLYRDGIPALMNRETQRQQTPFDFKKHYQPTPFVAEPCPVEDIDFNSDGSYSGYNWELFFHVPFLLACRLSKNQRFEEAMTWFHYIFNPTGALSGTAPQKYWVTKPFYLTQNADYVEQRIGDLMKNLADPTHPARAELEFAVDQWRSKPFQPHVIARFRSVAYQKAVIMKYIDNLVEWGDNLFRQDTMESIVQATQLYILADKLLGPKPRTVTKPIPQPYETYNQLEAKIDAFGNALIDLENILPDLSGLPEAGAELPPAPLTLSMLYFCIPQNEKMLDYWGRVEERLNNIRNCRNIDGVERSLALFAPPIDPGMLVRAAASGLDLGSILAGLNAPLPHYRFSVFAQKATELANEVRTLGSSLLVSLEKKDAEALSLLRNELEIRVLDAVKDVKKLQIDEAKEQIRVLERSKRVVEERFRFYNQVRKINDGEQLNLNKLEESHAFQTAAQITRLAGSIAALIPDFDLGASGFGGSPAAKVKFGGTNVSQAANIAGEALSMIASLAANDASRASIRAGYDRRFDDWKLQERLASRELDSLNRQLVAADIRKQIAETELRNHDLQRENARETDVFMRSKFTNKELYEWSIGQIASVYFAAYQLAHDTAKKAERCYRFELGNDDSFIAFGYWDNLKKGLQSADKLLHDIKRMETGYLDRNKREYEITKHVSLARLDPMALIRLRTTGSCDFDVPEVLFDLDHPGQYFRRIKTVSLSLPCVAGPYTSVSAKLSLVSNKYRKNTQTSAGYPEDPGNDDRFVYGLGAIQSVVTSNAQNDSGMFELNFRDDRYLPFEGMGAVGSWRLELPKPELSQFDYDTIADVVVHIRYTAREGGFNLRDLAEQALLDQLQVMRQQLGLQGMHVAINLRHDMPNAWHTLQTTGSTPLTINTSHLPYLAQTLEATVENVGLFAKVKENPMNFAVTVNAAPLNLALISAWGVNRGVTNAVALDTPFTLAMAPPQLAALNEILLVVKYVFP